MISSPEVRSYDVVGDETRIDHIKSPYEETVRFVCRTLDDYVNE